MGKICFFCGSNRVIKKGLKQGKQRWLCKSCNRLFVQSSRVNPSIVRDLYSQGNLTVRQIADSLKVDERTIYRHLSRIETRGLTPHKPSKIIAMMDATYWGWNFGDVAIKDHISGNVLWSKFIDRRERIDDYVEGIETLKKEGFEILCIVSDGLKGQRERLSSFRFQYCQFHRRLDAFRSLITPKFSHSSITNSNSLER